MAMKTITASPAAGPLTLTWDPERRLTIRPPIIPAITPEKRDAPDPRAMPRQRGSATRKVTNPAGPSCLSRFPKVGLIVVVFEFSIDPPPALAKRGVTSVPPRYVLRAHYREFKPSLSAKVPDSD